MKEYHCAAESLSVFLLLKKFGYQPDEVYADGKKRSYYFDKPLSAYAEKYLGAKNISTVKYHENYVKLSFANNVQDIFVFRQANNWIDYLNTYKKYFSPSIILSLTAIVLLVCASVSHFYLGGYFAKHGLKHDEAIIFRENLQLLLLQPYIYIACIFVIYLFSMFSIQSFVNDFVNKSIKENPKMFIKNCFMPFLISYFLGAVLIACGIYISYILTILGLATCLVFPLIIFFFSKEKKIFEHFSAAVLAAIMMLMIVALLSLLSYIILYKTMPAFFSKKIPCCTIVILIPIFCLMPMVLPLCRPIFFKKQRRYSFGELLLIVYLCCSAYFFMYIFCFLFMLVNPVKDSGLGGYTSPFYIDERWQHYPKIIEKLHYDKTDNEIHPWVVLNTQSFLVLAADEKSKTLYKFHLKPFYLDSFQPEKAKK